MSVCLQQQWSLEALSWSSSWPSRTMARHCSNPWSKFSAFRQLCEWCVILWIHSNLHFLPSCHIRSLVLSPFSLTTSYVVFYLDHFPLFFYIPPPTHSPHNISLARLWGHIKLLPFQRNLDIRLKADIILVYLSQMLNRHFGSSSFQVTRRIL